MDRRTSFSRRVDLCTSLARQKGAEGGTLSSGGNNCAGNAGPGVFRTVVEVRDLVIFPFISMNLSILPGVGVHGNIFDRAGRSNSLRPMTFRMKTIVRLLCCISKQIKNGPLHERLPLSYLNRKKHIRPAHHAQDPMCTMYELLQHIYLQTGDAQSFIRQKKNPLMVHGQEGRGFSRVMLW